MADVWGDEASSSPPQAASGPPPPYTQPPSYYNTASFAQSEDDPFDTSKLFESVPKISTQITPSRVVLEAEVKSVYIQGDIANRSMNYTVSNIKPKEVQVATSKGVTPTHRELATGIIDDLALGNLTLESPVKNNIDSKFMSDLETYLTSKKNNTVPILQPPPQNPKKINNVDVLPKVQNGNGNGNGIYSNLEGNLMKNSIDKSETTANVLNKIWRETSAVENRNLMKICKSLNTDPVALTTNYGQFQSNRHYDPVYTSTSSGLDQYVAGNNPYQAIKENIYNNGSFAMHHSYPSTSTLYNNSQTAVYGSYNSVQYSEVPPESVYSEISDNLYSQVPDELKPHRPAPPSPMIQSMQQIQRKMQQGQVLRQMTIRLFRDRVYTAFFDVFFEF